MNDDINKDLGIVTAYAYAVSKGYTGTEDEFAALMADYAAVGQRAEAAATAAAASATAASGSASDSAASQAAASTSAGTATTAAQNAAQSATAASGSATAAAGSATQAAGSATTAGNKATEAAQSATAAAASATAAGQSATAAQTAQTAAETAQTAAETAQTAAEDAAESVSASAAQIAQNTADISSVKNAIGEIDATLITDEASGAIATFSDGADGYPMRSVVVDMEPIQNLNGQDAPYPAGGGKNLCPIATMDTTSGGNINASCGAVGTVEAGVTYTFSLVNKTTSTANLHVRMVIDGEYSDVASGNLVSGGSKSYTFTPTVSGEVTLNASIGSVYSPAFENLQLEKGSTATAYAPYSNICPISGRDTVTVTRAGKNLLDYATFSVGTISSSTGEAMSASNRLRSDFIRVASGKYTLSSVNGFDVVFDVYDMQKNYVRSESNVDWQTTPHTYTVIGDRYVRLLFRKSDNSSITLDELTGEQMEFNSTATAYEAPNIQHITIPLGKTVYGGTVDAVSGTMTVDRAMVDLGSLTWARDNALKRFLAAVSDSTAPNSITTYDGISSMYKSVPFDDFQINLTRDGIMAMSTGKNLSVRNLSLMDNDAAQFKTAMTGQTLVYPLATPQTITLTAQQLTTLLGTNNVWSDADSVSVDYVADTKKYIAKVIAAALA